MTTTSHLQDLIAQYYEVTGLLSAAIVELVTATSDLDARRHAQAVIDLSVGVNQGLEDLRRWVADPKVLGRDNFYQQLLIEAQS